jgi:branched-chain amino acid transport system ATP-binding protein
VEQNVRRALELCHRGYVIENGEVALAGSRKDLLRSEHVRRAYLGL